jgi:hypothetical protein
MRTYCRTPSPPCAECGHARHDHCGGRGDCNQIRSVVPPDLRKCQCLKYVGMEDSPDLRQPNMNVEALP